MGQISFLLGRDAVAFFRSLHPLVYFYVYLMLAEISISNKVIFTICPQTTSLKTSGECCRDCHHFFTVHGSPAQSHALPCSKAEDFSVLDSDSEVDVSERRLWKSTQSECYLSMIQHLLLLFHEDKEKICESFVLCCCKATLVLAVCLSTHTKSVVLLYGLCGGRGPKQLTSKR